MTETYPPLVIPPKRALVPPPIRPINTDPDCVIAMVPDDGTQWRDYSGNSNHATNSGCTRVYNCRLGLGWSFDGVNDYFTITHSTSLADFTALSVSMWIYPTDVGGTGTLRIVIQKGAAAAGSSRFWISDVAAGRVAFVTRNNLNAQVTTNNDGLTPANRWYHVVGVYNGATQVTYVNAVAGTPTARTGTLNSANDILISQSSNDFKGYMDELLYFRRGLTQQEVSALFEAGRPLGVG